MTDRLIQHVRSSDNRSQRVTAIERVFVTVGFNIRKYSLYFAEWILQHSVEKFFIENFEKHCPPTAHF